MCDIRPEAYGIKSGRLAHRVLGERQRVFSPAVRFSGMLRRDFMAAIATACFVALPCVPAWGQSGTGDPHLDGQISELENSIRALEEPAPTQEPVVVPEPSKETKDSDSLGGLKTAGYVCAVISVLGLIGIAFFILLRKKNENVDFLAGDHEDDAPAMAAASHWPLPPEAGASRAKHPDSIDEVSPFVD